MKRLDLNCYCGNWPFFRIRYNTLDKISELHSRCGIEGGIISACEAIFYQDPYEAEVQLSQAIAGTNYIHAMILNPTIPGWQADLSRAVNNLKIKAVRLMPGFHNYSLQDPVLEQVCNEIRSYSLPLILTLRIRDERTSWMFAPNHIPLEDVAAFLDKTRDIPTLLACARSKEVILLKEQFVNRSNLFTDISGFKDGNYVVETVSEQIGSEHIVYGSSAPLLEMQSTTIMIDKAKLPEQARAKIFSGEEFLKHL